MDKITNKSELSAFIQTVMKEMANNKAFKNHIIEFTLNRVVQMKISNIFNSLQDDLVILDDSDIYWISKALLKFKETYEYYKFNKLDFEEVMDLSKYFNNTEKNSAEMTLFNKQDIPTEFVIEGVEQIGEDIWICSKFPYSKVAEAFKYSFSTYNFNTQREAKVKNIGIDIIKEPTIYNNNINEIKKVMLNKDFEPNMITWNILRTGEEEFYYDESTKTLTLITPANIADGMHRSRAANDAVVADPSLADDFFILKITHYDVEKAQKRIILQESKGNKISKERQKALEPSKSVEVVKRLNEHGSSDTNIMYGMITDNIEEVFKIENKYCLVSAISDVLDETYKDYLKTALDINKIRNYLSEFFIEFFSYNTKAIYDISIKESREKYILLHNNMFSLATYLAKVLYEQPNWQNILKEFMSTHDFSVNNAVWNTEIKINTPRSNPSNRRKIYVWVDKQINRIINNEVAVAR